MDPSSLPNFSTSPTIKLSHRDFRIHFLGCVPKFEEVQDKRGEKFSVFGFGNLQLQVYIAATTREAASEIKSIESLSLRTEYKLHIYYHPISAPVVTNSPDFPPRLFKYQPL